MVSLRVDLPETLRRRFQDFCLDHEPRLSMSSAITSLVEQVLAGKLDLPPEAKDKRLDPSRRK